MILLPIQKEEKTERSDLTGSILCDLHERGILLDKIEEYTRSCRERDTDETAIKVKRRMVFPNVAGFCRFVETGISDFYSLKDKYPLEYDKLLAIFEDEALNSDISSSLLSSYMKKRMLYSFDEGDSINKGDIAYCFEHDVYADGE